MNDQQKQMTEKEWNTVRDVARSLATAECDPNEVTKLLSYLRVKSNITAFQRIFKIREMMLDRPQGNMPFVRSGQTSRYWQAIRKMWQDYYQLLPQDAERLLLVLGWAARLMRYYNTDTGKAELAERQRTGKLPELSKKQVQPDQPLAQQPSTARSPTAKPTAPPPPRVETGRELVKLISVSRAGKAHVRTAKGEEIPCANLPAYPPAKEGAALRAEVTRENGQAVKAVFKSWDRG